MNAPLAISDSEELNVSISGTFSPSKTLKLSNTNPFDVPAAFEPSANLNLIFSLLSIEFSPSNKVLNWLNASFSPVISSVISLRSGMSLDQPFEPLLNPIIVPSSSFL